MPRINQRMLQFLTILLAALFLCGPAFSQYDTGSIAGTVVDQHGGALANAAVTATNQGTGQVHETTTNEQGVYVFPSLPSGKYRVEAIQPGFAAGVVSEI